MARLPGDIVSGCRAMILVADTVTATPASVFAEPLAVEFSTAVLLVPPVVESMLATSPE